MKKNTEPIECDRFYHIYNRGINGETIFKEERNYAYFLKKYAVYIQPIAETYAYCLLKNHFHLLVKTRSTDEILENMKESEITRRAGTNRETTAVKHISNQFAKLFNGYSQAINKAHHRTGSLFENVFRRIPVDSDHYFLELVYYIHANPQKHGFVKDFREYPHSSYHTHLSKLDTKLKRAELLTWFGSTENYDKYHLPSQILNNLNKFEIEVD